MTCARAVRARDWPTAPGLSITRSPAGSADLARRPAQQRPAALADGHRPMRVAGDEDPRARLARHEAGQHARAWASVST